MGETHRRKKSDKTKSRFANSARRSPRLVELLRDVAPDGETADDADFADGAQTPPLPRQCVGVFELVLQHRRDVGGGVDDELGIEDAGAVGPAAGE